MGKNVSGGLDKLGDVFIQKDIVYRGINMSKVDYFNQLYSCGLLQELRQKKLIPDFSITNNQNEHYPIILAVKKLAYTEPNYWSPNMLLDAGKTLLQVHNIAQKYGYKLIDAHPFNIMFDCGRAVFVDFGSFIPLEQLSYFDDEFLRGICAPLVMWKTGNSFWAQKLLRKGSGFYQRISPSEDILSTSMFQSCLNEFAQKHNPVTVNKLFVEKQFSEDILEELFVHGQIGTFWQNYQEFLFESDGNFNNEKMKRYYTILRYVKKYASPTSDILDLAGNYGGMSYLIRKNTKIKNAYSMDYDLGAIETGYHIQKEKKSDISLLLENFMLPANLDIFENIKADIVLAMAVTHHLLLTQNYTIDQIFSRIKSYSKKYVFIEFMPHGLWGGGDLPPIPDWYTLDWFTQNFKKHFTLLKVKKLEFNRILFIGRLKDKIMLGEKIRLWYNKFFRSNETEVSEQYTLFNFIPLLRITGTERKKKYYLFNFIPLSKYKEKANKKKYYLFNFIPLLKIKEKRNQKKYYLFNFILLLKIKKK